MLSALKMIIKRKSRNTKLTIEKKKRMMPHKIKRPSSSVYLAAS
jgi:hypothetical protein